MNHFSKVSDKFFSAYLDSNYGLLKPEGLARQYLDSNYGHLKPEGLAGQYSNSNYGHLET